MKFGPSQQVLVVLCASPKLDKHFLSTSEGLQREAEINLIPQTFVAERF